MGQMACSSRSSWMPCLDVRYQIFRAVRTTPAVCPQRRRRRWRRTPRGTYLASARLEVSSRVARMRRLVNPGIMDRRDPRRNSEEYGN